MSDDWLDLFTDGPTGSETKDPEQVVAAWVAEIPDTMPTVAEVLDPIYDHPVVKDLMDQLAHLSTQMNLAEKTFKEFDAKYNDAKNRKEDFLKSVNEQIRSFDVDMRNADQARRDIEQQMAAMRQLREQANAGIDAIAQDIKLKQATDEAEAHWRKLMGEWDFIWASAIKTYQLECIKFATDAFETDLLGVLIADQQGLGKTLEASATIDVIHASNRFTALMAQRLPELDTAALQGWAILWLCPTAVKKSTVAELRKWGRDNALELSGPPEVRKHIVRLSQQQGMVLVVGYEQLRERNKKPITPELFEQDWPIVVLDEAHKFKNENSSTFSRVEQLCERAGFLMPMTGTPILNRPAELWSILHMLTLGGKYEGRFQDKWRFEAEYLNTWSGGTEFQYGAYDRLIASVEDMVIRRRKDEVLQDLPDKVREIRYVQMAGEQLDLYNEMRDKFIIWLDEQKSDFVNGSNVLAQLTYLRQLALLPSGVKMKSLDDGPDRMLDCTESAKIDEAMDVMADLVDSDEKVLVFANFNEPLQEVRRRVEAAGWTWTDANGEKRPIKTGIIIGGQNEQTRMNYINQFNDPTSDVRVMVGNIAAMGTGLNLQAACSNSIFLDLFWNPGVNEQAEDRLHRTGQKNAVTITIIQCEDSVDGFIAKIIEDKSNMIEGIIERGELRKALHDGLI